MAMLFPSPRGAMGSLIKALVSRILKGAKKFPSPRGAMGSLMDVTLASPETSASVSVPSRGNGFLNVGLRKSLI